MRGILAAIIAIIFAQALKVPIKGVKTGEWDARHAFSSGGMPSSHSAAVTSLATYIGLRLGARSLDFALSMIFGLIVMYDAQGVRKHAGKTAIRVNELEKRIDQLSGENHQNAYDKKTKRLKESIGHQLEEVVGGALLGFVVGLITFFSNRGEKYQRVH